MEPSAAELAKCAMLSVLATLVLIGCGGSGNSTTAPGGTGGSDAAGGNQSTDGGSDTGGAAGGSGTGGSANTGGSNTGGAGGGGTSPGKVTIDFTVAGGSFCMTSQCGEGPSVDIEGIALDRTCSDFSCQTCQPTFVGPGCTTIQCPPAEGIAVVGGGLSWDGTYYASSTCTLDQSQASCVEPAFAKPGKYTAKFCATPGTLSGPDGSARKCVVSGPLKCSTVDFDFPSSATVKGALGP